MNEDNEKVFISPKVHYWMYWISPRQGKSRGYRSVGQNEVCVCCILSTVYTELFIRLHTFTCALVHTHMSENLPEVQIGWPSKQSRMGHFDRGEIQNTTLFLG